MTYLKNKIYKLELFQAITLAAIPFISFYIGQHFQGRGLFFQFIIGGTIGVVTFILITIRDMAVRKQSNYSKGVMGEEYVEEILKKLPVNYKYKKSIDNKYGNADFLVMSENGIFCLEVKNISGKITYNQNDKQLLRNYYPFTKDYIKQVKRNSYEINKAIRNKIGRDIFINPVLVFSGRGVSLELENRIDGVAVIMAGDLYHYILNQRGNKINEEVLLLVKNIM